MVSRISSSRGTNCAQGDIYHILPGQNWPRCWARIETALGILVPPAIVARLCTIASDLSALALRARIFNPVVVMADRRSRCRNPRYVRCSVGHVRGLPNTRTARVLGVVNGEYGAFCFVFRG
jgi:hypothetical protein